MLPEAGSSDEDEEDDGSMADLDVAAGDPRVGGDSVERAWRHAEAAVAAKREAALREAERDAAARVDGARAAAYRRALRRELQRAELYGDVATQRREVEVARWADEEVFRINGELAALEAAVREGRVGQHLERVAARRAAEAAAARMAPRKPASNGSQHHTAPAAPPPPPPPPPQRPPPPLEQTGEWPALGRQQLQQQQQQQAGRQSPQEPQEPRTPQRPQWQGAPPPTQAPQPPPPPPPPPQQQQQQARSGQVRPWALPGIVTAWERTDRGQSLPSVVCCATTGSAQVPRASCTAAHGQLA